MPASPAASESSALVAGFPPHEGLWTRSAKALLFSGIFFQLFGIAARQPLGFKFGLVVAGFILVDWIQFSLRVRAAFAGGLRVSRGFPGLTSERSVWAGAPVETIVRVENHSAWTYDDLEVWDLAPGRLFRASEGGLRGRLRPKQAAQVPVRYTTRECGRTMFPGFVLRFGSFSGLFYCEWILPVQDTINVYPHIIAREKLFPVLKQGNRQWTLGIHEHRDKGMSMNLLELRDYIPGDPPKKIFWKASARHDRLIVRETESEVPVRVMLVLDAGGSMRLQTRSRTALDFALVTAATLAKVVSDHRDPVGLYCFHETGGDWVLPRLGKKHLYSLLRRMNEHAGELSTALPSSVDSMVAAADAFARGAWPGLFDRSFNKPAKPFFRWSRRYWNERSRRKQLAICLAARYGEPVAAVEHWLADPAAYAPVLRRFCNEFSLRQAYDLERDPDALFRESAPKLRQLARAVRYMIQRAKDNELIVIASDLAGGLADDDAWEDLAASLRLAVAQHHRVIVTLPWLPHFTAASKDWMKLLDMADDEAALRAALDEQAGADASEAYAKRMDAVRHRLARTGAQLVELGPEDGIRSVLAALARMKYQKGALR